MKTKELEIVAPDGYEIDKENSTFEKIIFKKIDSKPRSWDEFCERGFTGEEAYVSVSGVSKSSYKKGLHRTPLEVGYVDNVKEAQAFCALMQLRQLRKAWVGDWEPDWCDDGLKSIIRKNHGRIDVLGTRYSSNPMSFPTMEMAKDFLNCFKGLLEQAKILL